MAVVVNDRDQRCHQDVVADSYLMACFDRHAVVHVDVVADDQCGVLADHNGHRAYVAVGDKTAAEYGPSPQFEEDSPVDVGMTAEALRARKPGPHGAVGKA